MTKFHKERWMKLAGVLTEQVYPYQPTMIGSQTRITLGKASSPVLNIEIIWDRETDDDVWVVGNIGAHKFKKRLSVLFGSGGNKLIDFGQQLIDLGTKYEKIDEILNDESLTDEDRIDALRLSDLID